MYFPVNQEQHNRVEVEATFGMDSIRLFKVGLQSMENEQDDLVVRRKQLVNIWGK